MIYNSHSITVNLGNSLTSRYFISKLPGCNRGSPNYGLRGIQIRDEDLEQQEVDNVGSRMAVVYCFTRL